MQAIQPADRLAIQATDVEGVPHLHTPFVDGTPQGPSVQHVGLHRGGHAFPLTRSEGHGLDGELADVGQHLLGAFREVDHHGQPQARRDPVDLLGGPGRRDVAQILHARFRIGGMDQALRVVDQEAVREHHPLGFARGPRGVGQHRHIIGRALRDQRTVQPRVLRIPLKPLLLHRLEGAEDRVVVGPHACVIPVHDMAKQRQLALDVQALVHLFLVLGEEADRLAVLQQILHFVRRQIRIQGDHFAAQRVRRELRPVVLRLVLANDRHRRAALHAHVVQAQCQLQHIALHLRKGVFTPDAALLVALRQPLGCGVRVASQQLRQCFDLEHHCPPSPR